MTTGRAGEGPPMVNRYLSNLYERRSTAEYSPQWASEFTKEEVEAFFA
jgi:hypothetical protein